MIAIVPGFLAGLVHVFSGPDHLAAVAPLAVKDHRRAWIAGLKWGAGHALGVAIIGVGALWLRGLAPVDLISSWSERLVGVLLIGIAIWGFRRALRHHVHTHAHTHDGNRHVHIHVHSHGYAHDETVAHQHGHTALGIGALHGLAGGAHFVAVLPALALPTQAQAVAYVVAYGVGTVVAMASFSTLVGLFATLCDRRGGLAYRRLMMSCSIAAFGIGCFWLVR